MFILRKMVIKTVIFIAVIFIAVILVACASYCTDYCASYTGERESSEERLIIYTSFHAMYDFTRTIAGDVFAVYTLIPPGASAHHWEPSAQDMVRLASASAFIYHGAGMEHFTDALRAGLGGSSGLDGPNEKLVFIEASKDVVPSLPQYERADPHFWLNPMYAKQIKQTITEALIEIDPCNIEVFNANFEESKKRLLELDKAFEEAARTFARRDIVVSHGAFGHLSYAYGLNQVIIEGLQVRTDPSPARMVDIITFVRNNDVTTIFYDKDPALANAVAGATGVQAVMLDTFEGVSDYDYFTVMWSNLEVLIYALS